MKSGFVSIVGRPNVGKSTLLNRVLEMKLAITSNVSGTTRNIIQGIYNDDESQIVFIDTPGIHKPVNKLGSIMNNQAYHMLDEVDIVLFLVDVTKEFGKGDNFVLEKIKSLNKPVFLVLNKIDLIDKKELLKIITKYNEIYNFEEIIPLSSLKGDNVLDLIKTLKKYLPREEILYGKEDVTNISRDFYIAEIVREKLLRLTKDEVPHTITCLLENYEENEKYIDINVLIIVDRENLKKIIIGKNGQMLKKVGTLARSDIEEFLGKQVNLKTYVKVIDDWREKEKYLKELGFYELK
ncbi:MAG: GTPase Era [Bacilli bacterium]|nr:GTPase Era [Bacilli bacterium]